jgi:adenylate cyclase
MLDFRGTHHYERVSVRSVLNGAADTKPFAGKVLIVAMTARQTVKDLVSTSLVTDAYGAEVHATIAEQLIRAAQTGRRPPRAWHDLAEHGWMLGWTLAGTLIAIGIRRPLRFALVLSVSIAALLAACFFAFVIWGYWIPALPPLLGCAVAAGFVTQYLSHHERSERGVLNDLFNRIVDKDVAKTIWARRDELLDHGQLAARELRATVLFTDLEGFTTITEAMDKTCLMRFLNDYMTAMSDVVGRKPDAFVNKYIGDAIMAVFGPPLERTIEQSRTDARNAVECALEMRARLAEHRARWERECSDGIRKKLETGATPGAVPPWAAQVRPPEVSVRMRIGIQSGMVTAGSLGSRQRLEYTVIGDTVNTAARLESFDKDLMAPDLAAAGCRILIGQDTLDLLPPGEYLTREVGSIQLKGKEQHVTIHGVIGRADFSTPSPTRTAAQEVNV